MAESLDTLVNETRARREALHALIERIRGDHTRWRQALATLPLRARLTVAQRQAFRHHARRGSHGA